MLLLILILILILVEGMRMDMNMDMDLNMDSLVNIEMIEDLIIHHHHHHDTAMNIIIIIAPGIRTPIPSIYDSMTAIMDHHRVHWHQLF